MRFAAVGVAVSLLIFILSSSTAMAVSSTGAEAVSVSAAVKTALVKAWISGRGGFLAGVCQVVAFMWLRTAMNYQYKNGGSLPATLSILWAEGGIGRLYKGLFPWAILQAPLSRFGDTAANQLVLGIRAALFPMVPLGVATVIGSFSAASWRVIITPIDTCKTTLQTDGAKGWNLLMQKIKKGGIPVLWYGWEGNYLANVVGNYPFFVVYNLLAQHVPLVEGMWLGLMRLAFIGAVSATVSDVTSNSIRVVKTQKQTSDDPNLGYLKAATNVIKSDGFFGFMFRGLDTRIFTNILQGAFFTVLWKGLFSN
jgi:hypothetical protein